MASSTGRSSSSRSSFSNRSTPLMPGRVVVAYDATKNQTSQVFRDTITNIRKHDGMIQEGDTITVLGVLHKVLHPMGFHMKIGPDSLFGTHARVIKEDSARKLGAYVSMLQHSADECQGNGIYIEAKIAAGAPVEKVVLQEVAASNATWIVLDWQLRKKMRYYLKCVTCKVALVLENLSLDVLRPYYSDSVNGVPKHKPVYELSKPVFVLPTEVIENNEGSVISSGDPEIVNSVENTQSQKNILVPLSFNSKESEFSTQEEFGSNPQKEKSGVGPTVETECCDSHVVMLEQPSLLSYSDVACLCNDEKMECFQNSMDTGDIEIEIATVDSSSKNAIEGSNAELLSNYDDSEPILLTSSGLEVESWSMRYSYSEINIATDNFSPGNLLCEAGYGVVYRGRLENGQLISAKVQKEADIQGNLEFLMFARHKNIELFLGYCCNGNVNILVFEFICNKSLEWHLLGNTGHVLDWHQRHSISIGIAKGLRFLHEECRGSPIIHGQLRPCNILLTHDFVPLLGNCGLANLITSKENKSAPTHATAIAYHAPEFAENGAFSIKSDVYAFGIILIQLISGQRCETAELSGINNNQSLVQWALPLIRMLSLDELVDPRLGDSYSIYDLYNMASAACLCVQTKPEMRPSMGEILRLLEGKSARLEHLTGQMKQDITYEQTCTLTTCSCG
ncbi:serine/threonine-protein kinase-like [Dorcoceras hygrometricum]|uniref:Serine/threonine-protein kinase-like n=1 Tax=Dorcoceras hygrometricum TaxID=472368 RepID=A0A2Z7C4B8_9LAMI|nr:serine/threonine-protein kinase-like [Dorcoceras hygrometricum]